MDRIATFKSFMEQRPDDPFPVYSIAMEYKNAQSHEEAQQYFDILHDKFSDYLAAYFHAAANLCALERKDDAMTFYREGIELADKAGNAQTKDELVAALAELVAQS
jgi:tetratricopeptide (TPR) repeat protein